MDIPTSIQHGCALHFVNYIYSPNEVCLCLLTSIQLRPVNQKSNMPKRKQPSFHKPACTMHCVYCYICMQGGYYSQKLSAMQLVICKYDYLRCICTVTKLFKCMVILTHYSRLVYCNLVGIALFEAAANALMGLGLCKRPYLQ